MRKISPSGNRQLPTEVVQVLGRMPFGVKEQLQLVRLGNKLVLLLTSLDHTQPIGEVTDPQEVEYLTSLCQTGKRGRGALASAVTQSLRNRSANPTTANVYPNTHPSSVAAASSSIPQPATIPGADRYQPMSSVNDSANAGLINVLRSLENTIRSRPHSTTYEA
jgi:flagellar biogenesis protein FliO